MFVLCYYYHYYGYSDYYDYHELYVGIYIYIYIYRCMYIYIYIYIYILRICTPPPRRGWCTEASVSILAQLQSRKWLPGGGRAYNFPCNVSYVHVI